MKRFFLASLAFAPMLFATNSSADTLEEALAAAYRNNPTLTEARLGVQAAREDRVQARAAYLPQASVSSSYGVQRAESQTQSIFGPQQNTAELEPSTTSVQVTQQLLTGGRREGQEQLAAASMNNARQGLRATEQDIVLSVVEAYLSVLRDEEVLRLRQEHVEGLTRQVNGTQRRLDVGEVSRTDLAQAQTRLAGARASLARAEATLASSRARYAAVVGQGPDKLTRVAAPPETPYSLEDAVRYAERHHPDVLRARVGEDAARARVRIERAALLPQVSLVGRYDESVDNNFAEETREGSSAVAQFSVPLFEGGYAWSRTRQGRVNVQRAQALTEAQRREIVSQVTSAWSNLEASRQVVQAAREQVEAAEFAVEGAERERGLGLRTTLDVLNAEEEAREAQIALARADAESTFAVYALLAATGTLAFPGAEPQD